MLELQPDEYRLFERAVENATAAFGEAALAFLPPAAALQLEPEPEPEATAPAAAAAAASAAEEAADDSDTADEWDASSSEGEEAAEIEPPAPPPPPAAAAAAASPDATDPALDAAAAEASAAFAEQTLRPGYAAMLAKRQALPAYAAAPKLERLLGVHGVLIVSGATGCGKSTQLPQLILDKALRASPPEHCSIIVTQPRRLAAVGLAQRVAAERDEEVGATVGYSIRGESRRSKKTRILFCTIGVLLKQLEGAEVSSGGARRGLGAVTHIVVDEVHERSLDVDLLLVYLRRAHALHATGAGATPPKLVLMSATAETERLARYFSADIGAPAVAALSIEGRTFPVERKFLEDAVLESGYMLQQDAIASARRGQRRGARQQPSFARRRGLDDMSEAVEGGSEAAVGEAAEDWMREAGEKGMLQLLKYGSEFTLNGGPAIEHTPETVQTLRSMDLLVVNVDLIVLLTAKLVQDARGEAAAPLSASQDVRNTPQAGAATVSGGAVLIFLPGLKEIDDTLCAMAGHSVLGDPDACVLFKLHSSVSTEEQSAVFKPTPPGTTKIVVSTNIAETSITIDDVTAVIDAGLHKEMRYSPAVGVRALTPARVALASATQRAGRAGRVRAGVCYHLFLKAELSSMESHVTPEVLRADLRPLCLRLLAQRRPEDGASATGSGNERVVDGTVRLLSELLDPPATTAVRRAIRGLRALGALDDTGTTVDGLSVLGRSLSRMPTDLWIAKLLLYGVALRVLTPVCVIAASVTAAGLWLLREESKARQGLDPSSDHLAALRGFNEWTRLRDSGLDDQVDAFCKENGLSPAGLEAVAKEAKRLKAEVLAVVTGAAARADENASNTGLVRGALVAALGAQLAQTINTDYTANPARLKYRLFLDDGGVGWEEVRALMHPASGLHGTRMALVTPEKATMVAKPFLVYSSVVKTSQVFLSGAAVVPPLLVALFCEDLAPASGADAAALTAGASKDDNRFSLRSVGGDTKLAVGGADELSVALNGSWRLRLRNQHAQLLCKLRAALRRVIESALEPGGGGNDAADAALGALATVAEQKFACAWQAPEGWVAAPDPSVATVDFCTRFLYTDTATGAALSERPARATESAASAAASCDAAREGRVGGLLRGQE